MIAKYAKTVLAVVGAAVYAAQAALSDGTVTNTEWIGIATAALIAAGVWAVPNAGNPVAPAEQPEVIAEATAAKVVAQLRDPSGRFIKRV